MKISVDYSEVYQASVYVPSEDEEITTSFSINTWQWWQPAIVGINCAVYFGCAIWLICLFMPGKKKEEE